MTINEVLKVASVSADAVVEWMSENNYWNTDNEADELFYITEGVWFVKFCQRFFLLSASRIQRIRVS